MIIQKTQTPTWDEPKQGRKQCLHCKKYYPNKCKVCPKCGTAAVKKPTSTVKLLEIMKDINNLYIKYGFGPVHEALDKYDDFRQLFHNKP
jgi:hypothetical protein